MKRLTLILTTVLITLVFTGCHHLHKVPHKKKVVVVKQPVHKKIVIVK